MTQAPSRRAGTRRPSTRRVLARGGALAALVGSVLAVAGPAGANHPVLVEGNCLGAGAAPNPVPGACGDYDGDGRVGAAEDTDGPDRVFGTINGALGNVDLGEAINATRANQNGRVTIVASGVFAEVVTITASTGHVTLEAAPGVDANIDAVLQGNAGSGARQDQPGIVVNAPANRRVIVRNVTSRNWTDGIQVRGVSHVTLDDVRVENNTDYGIHVIDDALVSISHSAVSASGQRTGVSPNNSPNPGIGIEFDMRSRGSIISTSVTGSFGAGVSVERSRNVAILSPLQLFDNNPNFVSSGR